MEWRKVDEIGPECEINREGVLRQKIMVRGGVVIHDAIRTAHVAPDSGGKKYYSFREGKQQHNRLAHILVARAFIPNPDGLERVEFIEGDTLHVDNLRWAPRPAPAVSHKLDEDKVREIRAALAGGRTGKDVAREFDVSEETISRIKRGKSWAGVK